MGTNNVTKIRRLIGKLRTIDDISKIVSAIDNRRIIVHNREAQKLNEQTWQWAKFLKPGDTLVQCNKNQKGIFVLGVRHGIGDTFTVIKVLHRLKAIVLRTQLGTSDRFTMDQIRYFGLTIDPPEDIAALALRKKIAISNGEMDDNGISKRDKNIFERLWPENRR